MNKVMNRQRRRLQGNHWRLRTVAVAASACLFGATPQAAVSVAGATFTAPIPLSIGPGDTELGLSTLFVGGNAAGSLSINGGSKLDLGVIALGTGGTGQGAGTLDGANNRMRLLGEATTTGSRSAVGAWGRSPSRAALNSTVDLRPATASSVPGSATTSSARLLAPTGR